MAFSPTDAGEEEAQQLRQYFQDDDAPFIKTATLAEWASMGIGLEKLKELIEFVQRLLTRAHARVQSGFVFKSTTPHVNIKGVTAHYSQLKEVAPGLSSAAYVAQMLYVYAWAILKLPSEEADARVDCDAKFEDSLVAFFTKEDAAASIDGTNKADRERAKTDKGTRRQRPKPRQQEAPRKVR
jgi:hypothetical protein